MAGLGTLIVTGSNPGGAGQPILFQEIPLSIWLLLVAAFLYATLGPLIVTNVVERWREWSRGSSSSEMVEPSLLGPIGLFLWALVFGCSQWWLAPAWQVLRR